MRTTIIFNLAARRSAALTSLCGVALACGSDAVEIRDVSPAAELGPAVMVANQIRTPEESNLYVGAFPSLPTDELDLSEMIEIGDASHAITYGGFVYVWEGEASQYTRYSVASDLSLVPGPVVSFANFGVTGPSITGFISTTRAYTMLSDALGMVVWDPSSMQVLGSISTEGFVDPDYPRVEYGEPASFGEYLAWPILWSDYDNLRFKPEVGVALTNIASDAPPIVLRDARCGAGWTLFTDRAGDLYVTGNAYFGFAHFFGAGARSFPADCVLWVKAGSTEFDPDYRLDLAQATASPAVYHTWNVGGGALLAAVWDPTDDVARLPSADDYWNAPLLRKLVLMDQASSTIVSGIPKSAVWSTLNFRLDDTLYVLESDGVVGGGTQSRSSLYRVTQDGVEKAFSSSGEVWSIGRVR
jgi:hypothetical protein